MSRFATLVLVSMAVAGGVIPAHAQAAKEPAAQPAPRDLAGELDELVSLAVQGRVTAAYFRSLLLVKLYPDEPRLLTVSKRLSGLLEEARGTGPGSAPAAVRKRHSFNDLQPSEQLDLTFLEKRMNALSKLDGDRKASAARDLLRDVKRFNGAVENLPRSWLLQARLAMALDRPIEGSAAADNLMALRVFESQSAPVIETMLELEKRGWVPK